MIMQKKITWQYTYFIAVMACYILPAFANDEDEIEDLLKDESLHDHTTALATLIALNILDVKIAICPGSLGMYHEKLGIFTDKLENSVSFKGSANETWNGWHEHGNYINSLCYYFDFLGFGNNLNEW